MLQNNGHQNWSLHGEFCTNVSQPTPGKLKQNFSPKKEKRIKKVIECGQDS